MSKRQDNGSAPSAAIFTCPGNYRPDLHFLETGNDLARLYHFCIVVIGENVAYDEAVGTFRKPWVGKASCKKIVIIWAAKPVDPAAMFTWRCGVIEASGVSFKFLLLPEHPPTDWEAWFRDQLDSWLSKPEEAEETALHVGSLVTYRQRNPLEGMTGYDPAFLTISPRGKMAEVLEQLDECKKAFHHNMRAKTTIKERRSRVHEVLDRLLDADFSQARHIDERRKEMRELSRTLRETLEKEQFFVDRVRLPRVLLLGPSGVGKTLVARYLAWHALGSENGVVYPFKRIPIPEYLNREADFEYDVFGYCSGAYTGALSGGRSGFLLEHIGGVVFLDEIGEANLAIQAKLLAYLDDYQVTPRGWVGEPVFCPLLIVAATNRRIDQWALKDDGGSDEQANFFRNDLLRRFNHIIHIPSVNERREELPSILDSMLQMPSFNPEGWVEMVGKKALDAIYRFDFDRGNFRDLENLVRDACQSARHQSRNYLVEKDVIETGVYKRSQ